MSTEQSIRPVASYATVEDTHAGFYRLLRITDTETVTVGTYKTKHDALVAREHAA